MTLHEPGISMPAGAVETSSARWVPPAAVLPILNRVEQLPEDASGALLVGQEGQELGSILVDRGRICWASSRDMATRLTTLLCLESAPPVSAQQLQDLYSECRSAGTPLLRALVDQGVVQERALSRVLLQHAAEAIALLSADRAHVMSARWVVRRDSDFNSDHSFSPAQVFSTIGALWNPASAHVARSGLSQSLLEGDSGVVFMRGEGSVFPVGLLGSESLSCAELCEVGKWVHSTLDISAALSGRPSLVSGSAPWGGAAVVWKRSGAMFLAVCDAGSRRARLVSRLFRELQVG